MEKIIPHGSGMQNFEKQINFKHMYLRDIGSFKKGKIMPDSFNNSGLNKGSVLFYFFTEIE